MKLSDTAYTILKWLCLVCIPAATTFYCALCAVWGFPYADEVAKTSAALCAFIGALLGVSTVEYNRQKDKEE